jgi:uncharacterized delta-60 repeat protein
MRSTIFVAFLCLSLTSGVAQDCPDPAFGGGGFLVDASATVPSALAIDRRGRILVGGRAGMRAVVRRYLADGALDKSFGVAGVATGPVGNVVAIAVQSNDALVVGLGNDFAVIRFDAAGKRDTGFGTSGVAKMMAPGRSRRGTGVHLQSNGSIVVVGAFWPGRFQQRIAMARYTSSGAPDSTYGSSGFFDAGVSDFVDGSTLQSNGMVVGVGLTRGLTSGAAIVVRGTTAGKRDCAFNKPSATGCGGSIGMTFGGRYDRAISVIQLSTGKLMVSGNAQNIGRGVLFRLNANGKLDTTFGTSGVAKFPVPTWPSALLEVSGGKLLVNAGGLSLTRFQANGTLDTTFGSQGVAHAPISAVMVKIAKQGNGMVVALGNAAGKIALVRYRSRCVALWPDVHEIAIRNGGKQVLSIDAGPMHAGRNYWILGSATGSKPGFTLMGLRIPLNPDPYMDLTIGLVNGAVFQSFRGRLDAGGRATASFVVPRLTSSIIPFDLRHACVLYDNAGKLLVSSNVVPVHLKN